MSKESYRETIQRILSDGNWHCILGLIKETGLSARNRISEMNVDNEEEFGFIKYEGRKCNLDHTFENQHKASLYMYRLNPEKYTPMYKDPSELSVEEEQIRQEEMKREDKLKMVNQMLKEKGLNIELGN
jgi:hypothetical protein